MLKLKLKTAWTLFFLACFIPGADADLAYFSYYPESVLEAQTSFELRQSLEETFTKVHYQEPGQRDRLVPKCPLDLPREGRCLEQKRSISYREARLYLFGTLHLEQNELGYFIEDQYCQNIVTEEDGVGPERIPQASIINCEHTWPQSRFQSRQDVELQKTDLHHLFPVDSRANSSRGNIPFGEVENQSTSLCEASKRGPTTRGTTAFEPPDQHKGNVARALFYFAVRYQAKMAFEEELTLRRWHELDPVDQEERSRHEKIYELQGVRNPFIDDPTLVSRIDDF